MDGFEAVASIAAESKPIEEHNDEQTEAQLAMLSKSLPHPSITPSSSSSVTTNSLPSLTPSRSALGSKDFASAIADGGSMTNILELLNSNKSFAPIEGSSSSDAPKIDQSNLLTNGLSTNSSIPSKPDSRDITVTDIRGDGMPITNSASQNIIQQTNNYQLVPALHPGNQQVVSQMEGDKDNFIDITEFLNLPQTEAAKKLGIPTSTLSKRWKEAAVNRKWPYRTVAKLDKEIMTLLHNIPQGNDAPPLPAEIETNLGSLLRRRQDELRTVVIRL